MEFTLVSVSVAAIAVLSVILYLSFDKHSPFFKRRKKISTNSGMKSKTLKLSEPLHVLGDSINLMTEE